MRRLRFLKVRLAFFASVFLFCLPAVAQVFQDDGNTADSTLAVNSTVRNRYTLSGDALDASSGAPLQKLQVDLRSDNGQTYLAALTDENGRFAFDNLPRGSYTLTTTTMGYDHEEQHMEITNGPVLGVELRLHKVGAADPENSGSTVSAHELTAPAKARGAMEKGKTLLYDKSDYQGSIRAFQKAIKESPKYYEAYALMGLAYMNLKDVANAENSLRKSLELSNEKYPQAYLFLAKLYSDNRRFSDAEPVARKVLELDSNSWQADAELTRALVGLNQLADAEKSAQAAITLQPGEPELYLALINIHLKLPNYAALLDDTEMYLTLAPNGRAAEQVKAMRNQLQQALARTSANPQQAHAAASDNRP